MSLLDLFQPPAAPTQRGKVVRQLKRQVTAAVARKVTPLAQGDELDSREARREKAARMKALNADPTFKAKTSARMKALHADPTFKANVAKGYARHRAFLLEQHIERLKAELVEARKVAEPDE
jgi:hypothetical protein